MNVCLLLWFVWKISENWLSFSFNLCLNYREYNSRMRQIGNRSAGSITEEKNHDVCVWHPAMDIQYWLKETQDNNQHLILFTLFFPNLLKNRNAATVYMVSFINFFSVMTYWRIRTVKSIPDQNLWQVGYICSV